MLFRSLPQQDREDLVLRDLAFLRWQIEAFDLRILVCTSATVLDRVLPLVNAVAVSGGQVARVQWKVAHGRANGRPVGVVGCSFPLARQTGLDVDGQQRLGSMLRDQLVRPSGCRSGEVGAASPSGTCACCRRCSPENATTLSCASD